MRRLLVPTMAALSALLSATPALAQKAAPAPAAAAAPGLCQADISKGARNAIVALQNAVVAKDSANIPALTAAAQALAKSNDDRCYIAQLQVKAAADANNLKAIPAALEVQLASGGVPATRIAALYEGLAQSFIKAGNHDDAATALDRAIALEPGQVARVITLAELRLKQKRGADALPLFRKAIAMERAAGRVPDTQWYGRALGVAHAAKNPVAYELAREWVAAYPSPANWRDAVRIYAQVSGASSETMVDLLRLQRQTGSLLGENEYGRYAEALITNGFAGEALAVLNEGIAAKTLDANNATIKAMRTLATSRAAGDRASLGGQEKAALANVAARPAMVLGEAYFGYGDYAKAAAMFRAAQGKSGVDAELANLRLGMALAANGDKAGAATALKLVTGPRAEVARYWETYARTRP